MLAVKHSSLGQRSPGNNLGKGQLLAVLKAYFDGSGKSDDPQAKFVTIAGFAAEDVLWAYFESEWSKILKDRGDPGHMHMHRAVQHREPPFEGWDADKVNYLIQGLIGLLREINASKKFCGFRVTVDLAAHNKYQIQNNLPPVAQLCANLSFAKMFVWYGDFPDLIITPFDVFFDRGDPFLNVLMQQWNNREITDEHPWWKLIRTIAPVDMDQTPPVQAADMLAWSHNRLKTFGPSGWAGWLATEIAQSVEVWHFDLDESGFAGRKFPNKYGFYT